MEGGMVEKPGWEGGAGAHLRDGHNGDGGGEACSSGSA